MPGTFDTPITTNDQSLDRVLAAGLPVLLVFFEGHPASEWERALQELAQQHAGDLLVVKVDVSDNPSARTRYQIKQTPVVASIREGKLLATSEAPKPQELSEHIAYLLGTGPKPKTPTRAQTSRGEASTAGYNKAGAPLIVTDATFEREVMGSSQPVLVDFWAAWCGPCKMIEPIVEKLAQENPDRLRVAKVNVDENPVTAQRYGVRSIPMMMVVKEGRIVDQWVGAQPEGMIRARLRPHLNR